MKILFFGDIVGGIGRKALKAVLPKWREQRQPDVVIANVENLAHGKGVTRQTLDELRALDIDVFTSGNHIWEQKQGIELLREKGSRLLRPANYPSVAPGVGSVIFEVGTKRCCVINLQGRVFMREQVDDPFRVADSILKSLPRSEYAAILVDFHAEATSEKVAFGWYVDGRVSAVLGTHTHVPTADGWILPQGMAYISDVGMTGLKEGVIGFDRSIILERFLTSLPIPQDIPDTGAAVVNAVYLETDDRTGAATAIELLHDEVIV